MHVDSCVCISKMCETLCFSKLSIAISHQYSKMRAALCVRALGRTKDANMWCWFLHVHHKHFLSFAFLRCARCCHCARMDFSTENVRSLALYCYCGYGRWMLLLHVANVQAFSVSALQTKYIGVRFINMCGFNKYEHERIHCQLCASHSIQLYRHRCVSHLVLSYSIFV